MSLGNEVVKATLGVERLPQLPPGLHEVEVMSTSKPTRTEAIVITVRIVASDSVPIDTEYSVYLDLTASAERQRAAQRGAVLRFVCGTLGARSVEEAETLARELLGCDLASVVDACMVAPGPFAGQLVRVRAVDTGLRTKPSATTQVTYPIVRYYWDNR